MEVVMEVLAEVVVEGLQVVDVQSVGGEGGEAGGGAVKHVTIARRREGRERGAEHHVHERPPDQRRGGGRRVAGDWTMAGHSLAESGLSESACAERFPIKCWCQRSSHGPQRGGGARGAKWVRSAWASCSANSLGWAVGLPLVGRVSRTSVGAL